MTATILYQEKVTAVPRAAMTGEDLWLTLADLAVATEWEMKPEGICRGELCVPMPEERAHSLVRGQGADTWFNLTEFARHIEQGYAHDAAHGVWCFGDPAWEWKSRLATRMAPDFTLADLQGDRFSLAQFRGKKVLLALWASW